MLNYSLFTLLPVLLYFCIALALAVSATRLLWIAGSYLKRKQRQLT